MPKVGFILAAPLRETCAPRPPPEGLRTPVSRLSFVRAVHQRSWRFGAPSLQTRPATASRKATLMLAKLYAEEDSAQDNGRPSKSKNSGSDLTLGSLCRLGIAALDAAIDSGGAPRFGLLLRCAVTYGRPRCAPETVR